MLVSLKPSRSNVDQLLRDLLFRLSIGRETVLIPRLRSVDQVRCWRLPLRGGGFHARVLSFQFTVDDRVFDRFFRSAVDRSNGYDEAENHRSICRVSSPHLSIGYLRLLIGQSDVSHALGKVYLYLSLY